MYDLQGRPREAKIGVTLAPKATRAPAGLLVTGQTDLPIPLVAVASLPAAGEQSSPQASAPLRPAAVQIKAGAALLAALAVAATLTLAVSPSRSPTPSIGETKPCGKEGCKLFAFTLPGPRGLACSRSSVCTTQGHAKDCLGPTEAGPTKAGPTEAGPTEAGPTAKAGAATEAGAAREEATGPAGLGRTGLCRAPHAAQEGRSAERETQRRTKC